jgi:thymidylate kinase
MTSIGTIPESPLAPLDWLPCPAEQELTHRVLYSESTPCGTRVVLATREANAKTARYIVERTVSENFVRVQQTRFMVGGLRIQFVRHGSGRLDSLAIEMIDPRSLLFSSFDDVVNRSKDSRHAALRDQFAFLLGSSVRGLPLTLEQRARLNQLNQTLGDEDLHGAISDVFGKSSLPSPVHTAVDRLRYWRNIVVRRPRAVASYAVSESARRLHLLLDPPGLFIVMLGPDGAGKSTAKNAIINGLRSIFSGTISWHWRPGVIWRVGPATPLRLPHAKQPRDRAMSILYLLAVFADTWVGYLRTGRGILMDHGLVTCDRYFRDVLVDPLRYRYNGPQWFPKFLEKLAPRPDLVIVLDADENVMFNRKPELTLEELRRQRAGYAQLAGANRNTRLIRSDVSIEQTSEDVLRQVIEFLSSRIAS